MSFIGLTKTNGEKIAISFRHLVAIEENEDIGGCRIHLRDSYWVDVVESYRSIFDVINKHGVDC